MSNKRPRIISNLGSLAFPGGGGCEPLSTAQIYSAPEVEDSGGANTFRFQVPGFRLGRSFAGGDADDDGAHRTCLLHRALRSCLSR